VNVLTADGTVFAIQQRYLGLTAAGAFQLPTEARNLSLRWEDAALISTSDEQVKVQSLERKSEKATECVSRKLDGGRAKSTIPFRKISAAPFSKSSQTEIA
jgi:hypothetical protein